MTFGELIKQHRGARSQSEIAVLVGQCDHARISRLENGYARPTTREIAALARVLAIDSGALLELGDAVVAKPEPERATSPNEAP